MGQLSNMLYLASIWVIPVVIAVTFHEAAHGFVARFLGDETAWKLGRVSLNPIKHIDPVGMILLPGFLLLLGSSERWSSGFASRRCCCSRIRRSCSAMPSRFRSIFERSEIRAAAWSGWLRPALP